MIFLGHFELGSLVFALTAGAALADGPDTLRLAPLLAEARARNPEIRAADARVLSMRERPVQEGTLPDPMVGLRYHNERSDRITFGDSDFSYVELAAEQPIPFPGKLGLKSAIAEREANRERAMRDATLFMVLAKVTSAYVDLAVVDRSREILEENLAVLDNMSRVAATSYSVGVATQQDVLRATLEQNGLQERLAMLEQKRTVATAVLDALLDWPTGALVGRAVWLETVPQLEPQADLERRIQAQAPELRAAQEELSRSDSTLALSRLEYFPDVAVMGAYMNKNGLFPEWEVGVKVNVPLYFWRRQRAMVAEATYARTAAEQTRRNTELELVRKLREFRAMGETALRLVALYGDTLIPQASLTLKSARASYAVGKVDFLTTLSAFTALLEYRMRQAEEIGNAYRARAEIGPLVGEPPPEDWGTTP